MVKLFSLFFNLIITFFAWQEQFSASTNELQLWDAVICSDICFSQTLFGFVHNLKTPVRKNISSQSIFKAKAYVWRKEKRKRAYVLFSGMSWIESDLKMLVFLKRDIMPVAGVSFNLTSFSQCLIHPPVCYANLHCFLGQKPRLLPLLAHAVAEGRNPTAYSWRLSVIRVPNPGTRLKTER